MLSCWSQIATSSLWSFDVDVKWWAKWWVMECNRSNNECCLALQLVRGGFFVRDWKKEKNRTGRCCGVRFFVFGHLLVVRTVLTPVPWAVFSSYCDPLIVIVLSRVCPIERIVLCSVRVRLSKQWQTPTSKQKKHQEHQNRSSNTRELEQPPTYTSNSSF